MDSQHGQPFAVRTALSWRLACILVANADIVSLLICMLLW